jgi:acylphosphatase
MKEAIHIIVHGRVQGVWFRAGTKEKADELGLLGWVKNRTEGTVEIHAEGEKLLLEKFITWCRIGTPAADVISIDIDEVMVQECKSFDIHS